MIFFCNYVGAGSDRLPHSKIRGDAVALMLSLV